MQTGDIKTGLRGRDGLRLRLGGGPEPKGVTAMLSAGTFGHGGAFGTQGWIDPKQDLFVVLLIQRTGLPNADASPMRQGAAGAGGRRGEEVTPVAAGCNGRRPPAVASGLPVE